MNVRHRHFSGGNEEKIIGIGAVHVFLKLGKLAGARNHLAPHHKRRPYFLIPMLLHVQVEHPVAKRSQQARTIALEKRELRPSNLRATREVENVQCRADVPMSLGFKAKLRPVAPDRMHEVLFFCGALRYATVGNVGNFQHCGRDALFDFRHGAIEALDPLADRAHLLPQGRERFLILGCADVLEVRLRSAFNASLS